MALVALPRTSLVLSLVLSLALGLAACGDDMVSTGAATTSTGAGSTSTAATSAGSSSEGSSDGASTASAGSTSDASASASEGSTSGAPEDAAYMAYYMPGGLDRIFIRKAEKTSDLCTELVVVWPGQGGDGDLMITTPAEWGVESASISQGVVGCLELEPQASPVVDAASGAGEVLWEVTGACPPMIDVDVTLDFIAGDLPWVPVKDQLSALPLPVQGC
ncbi:MAG: hypothetical protein KC420_20070 [Myxococcales bacterium]|nr:hypothetical protein [Myxococcales bacterium]